jgi:predicted metal-dependent hydrolase
MNHAAQFWALVAQQRPNYQQEIKALRSIERQIFSGIITT